MKYRDDLIIITIQLTLYAIGCLFLAGAIDNAVHYDGYWSAYKICLGVLMSVGLFRTGFLYREMI